MIKMLILWILLVLIQSTNCEDCYSLGCTGRRHFTYREYRQVTDLKQCFQECRSSRMCQTFSFKIRDYTYSRDKNCLLSDMADDKDTLQDSNWNIYTLKSCQTTYNNNNGFNNQVNTETACYKLYATKSRIDYGSVSSSLRTDSLEQCKLRCVNGCYGFAYSHNSRYENCFLSNRQDLDRFLVRDTESDVFINNCRNGRENSFGFENSNEVNMFAVNGERCLNGGCRLNPDIGYWYCDIKSTGDWEYCCRPNQRCDYKNGSPWCYVGNAGTDQWRPCRPDNYVP